MKAIEIVCPACGAEPGELCRDIGVGDQVRAKNHFHVSRNRRAHYQTIAQRKTKQEGR